MKINGQYPKLPAQDKTVHQGQEKDVSKQTGISSKKLVEAKQIGNDFAVNRMRDKINAEPDINMERVEALKSKIKSGEYQIDNLKLANKILKSSLMEDS